MLGQSAGRSAGNPTRPGARRRYTLHEREVAKFAKDDPSQWPSADSNGDVQLLPYVTIALLGAAYAIFPEEVDITLALAVLPVLAADLAFRWSVLRAGRRLE